MSAEPPRPRPNLGSAEAFLSWYFNRYSFFTTHLFFNFGGR